MKKVLSIILILGILFASVACAGSPAEPAQANGTAQAPTSQPGETDEPFLIGVAINLTNEFGMSLERWYRHYEAQDDSFDLVIAITAESQAQQIAAVEAMIAQGVQAIIMRYVDETAAATMLNMIYDHGIYLIIDESLPLGDPSYHVWTKSENITHGENIGRYLQSYMAANPDRQLQMGYVIGGVSPGAMARFDGIWNIISEDDIPVLDFQVADGWNALEAAAIAEAWLTAYPEMNVIVSANDDMAVAIIEVLIAAGRMDDFMVFGVDGDVNGLEYLRRGLLTATSAQDTSVSSRLNLDLALKLLRGETIVFDNEEERSIDSRMITLVTLNNVDEFTS